MKRAIVAGLLAALTLLSALPAGAATLDELKRQIQLRQNELNRLKDKAERTQRDLNKVDNAQKKTMQELLRLEREIDQTEDHLDEVRKELSHAESLLEQAEVELGKSIEALAERTDLLGRRVRAIYEHGALTYLDVLFEANSFSDMLVRYASLEQIVVADIGLFRQAREYRHAVEDLRDKFAERRAQVMAVKQEVEQTKQHLESTKEEKESVRRNLLSDMQELEKALDELDAESNRITRDLQRLEKQYEEQLRREGAIVLARPVEASVTSGFGMRVHPILRKSRMHSGVDYAASYGTPVKAAESGQVFAAGSMGGYGKAVIILHGRGISTLYAHLSEISVAEGRKVEKGQVIGKVGSTGLSTGPHLHFEVRVNGVPQNPANYVGKVIN